MKIQFENASLVSVTNGSVVIKSKNNIKHTFPNASVISVNNGIIIIETEWEPKKGELIKLEGYGTDCYAIFKLSKDSILFDYGYKLFNGNKIINSICGWRIKYVTISPVTPEEQKEFDDFCKSQGKIWNKEKLQWEEYKWKPAYKEQFFMITTDSSGVYIINTVWNNCIADQVLYDYGNCFKTREEAEIKVNQIKNLFKNKEK